MLCAALSASAVAIAQNTLTQTYPTKPIRFVIPFPPGGPADIFGRTIGQQLSDRWNQQVVIDNRAGAGGNIGADIVAKAPADGYTILMGFVGTHAINPSLYSSMPYDNIKDFTPVGLIATATIVLVTHPTVQAKSVKELIALAKAKPGSLAYASAGVGNFSHLAMELFSLATGVKLLHVPYKGTGPASLALIGGDVQMGFNNVQTLLQNVRGGQLRALAVAEPQRVAALPDVPTVAETVPGFSMAPWIGIIVPVKTPKEVVARLGEATLAVMRDPEVIKVLNEQQVTPMAMDSGEFEGLIKKDLDRWANVIKTAGIKGE
jgi:tripartite-type tricarboxylate transporter receptor subunit TctC